MVWPSSLVKYQNIDSRKLKNRTVIKLRILNKFHDVERPMERALLLNASYFFALRKLLVLRNTFKIRIILILQEVTNVDRFVGIEALHRSS